MLDISTLSLIVVMVGFICFAIIVVHHHKYSDIVRRKRGEVDAYAHKMHQKIDIVEKEIVDLKMQIDSLDEEIEALKV